MTAQVGAPRAPGSPPPARAAGTSIRLSAFSMPLVLLALMAVFAVLEPSFASTTNILNLLRQSSILALAAAAQSLLIILGHIDLSTGSAVALITVVAVMTAKAAGVTAGIAAGLLLGVVLGAINGVLVARWAVPSFIATVGMLSYARGIAYYLGGGMPIEFPPPAYGFLGSGYVLGVPVSVWVAAAVFLALHVLLHRTTLGRRMFATGGNREAARLSGIRTQRVEFVAFLLAGLVTGLAAVVLSSRVMSGQPTIAATLQFEAIAAVAIGGTRLGGGDGSMFRTAVGTLIIAVLSNGLTLANVSTFVQQMLIGAIMVGAVAVDQWQRRKGAPA